MFQVLFSITDDRYKVRYGSTTIENLASWTQEQWTYAMDAVAQVQDEDQVTAETGIMLGLVINEGRFKGLRWTIIKSSQEEGRDGRMFIHEAKALNEAEGFKSTREQRKHVYETRIKRQYVIDGMSGTKRKLPEWVKTIEDAEKWLAEQLERNATKVDRMKALEELKREVPIGKLFYRVLEKGYLLARVEGIVNGREWPYVQLKYVRSGNEAAWLGESQFKPTKNELATKWRELTEEELQGLASVPYALISRAQAEAEGILADAAQVARTLYALSPEGQAAAKAEREAREARLAEAKARQEAAARKAAELAEQRRLKAVARLEVMDGGVYGKCYRVKGVTGWNKSPEVAVQLAVSRYWVLDTWPAV